MICGLGSGLLSWLLVWFGILFPHSNAFVLQSTLSSAFSLSGSRVISLGRSRRTALTVPSALYFNVNNQTEADALDAPCPLLRAWEIGSVVGLTSLSLVGAWMSLSLSSATRTAATAANDTSHSSVDIWNRLWSYPIASSSTFSSSSNATTSTIITTNADRLVESLEVLGPTFVKFGQALSSRTDLVPLHLADALSRLQDTMAPFDTATARACLVKAWENDGSDLFAQTRNARTRTLLDSLSDTPVAAASIGQCYQSYLPGYGPVAVKVQRPGLHALVHRDRIFLTTAASWIESWTIPSWMNKNGDDRRRPVVQAKLVDAVEEFMQRLREELDYGNEVDNMEAFGKLYGSSGPLCRTPRSWRRRRRQRRRTSSNVIVPQVLREYCTDKVIVMEWIEGSKLSEVTSTTTGTTKDHPNDDSDDDKSSHTCDDETLRRENLELLETARACTLSQLFDPHALLHADPHNGNLLKVKDTTDGSIRLGYLDFGMVSTLPETVRDGLVCAVAQMVFCRNVPAVVDLLGELQLLDESVLVDATKRAALVLALEKILDAVLIYPDGDTKQYAFPQRMMRASRTSVPELRFDSLLGGLSLTMADFEFRLPPYFLNNARALATLEGITRKLDPSHNIMRAVYPFALKRLFGNPSRSVVVDETLRSLLWDPVLKRVSMRRMLQLLSDSAELTGMRRWKVVADILRTRGGWRTSRKVAVALLRGRLFHMR